MAINKIIHVDMDAFYASIEIRDQPNLAHQPVAVGGRRGVVLTANYEARRFGIHSGMPGFKASERCPHLIFIKPRFEAYKEASQKAREIYEEYTDIIAPRSLDEAYLDVTDHELYAVQIATQIREKVKKHIGITCSAGVSVNMMLAKIASDFRKPDGMTVILPEQIEEFMRPLPLRKIPGIGAATEARLAKKGLHTCQDIWNTDPIQLKLQLGPRMAGWISRRSRGEGSVQVSYRGERKSYGSQRSIGSRHHPIPELEQRLRSIAESLSKRMAGKHHQGRTLTLKVRLSNFKLVNRSLTLKTPTNDNVILGDLACELLSKTPASHEKVSLVGLAVTNLVRDPSVI